MRFAVGLLFCLASASGLVVAAADKEVDENGVDRLGHKRVRPRSAYLSSAALVTAATGVQLVSPGWLKGCLGSAAESGLGKFSVNCIEALAHQKKTNPLGVTLAHGVITKGCADVLAQTIPQQDAELVWIDPLRGFRSMLASVLSTSLPFYFWTRFMAAKMKLPFGGLAAAATKTLVTQACFRPLNIVLFLGLQSIFRGDTFRQLKTVMSTKFKSSLVGGVIFYSISNFLMYMVPIPFLHPIMGSVAGLVFNVWLAIVAYKK